MKNFQIFISFMLLLLLIFTSFGCMEKLEGKTVIKVKVNITEQFGRPVIQDIQAAKGTVGPLQEYKDTGTNTPGVFLITTTPGGKKIDYWVSKEYVGPGEYELISEIKSEPPEGIVIVTIKVVDENANVIAKDNIMIDW